MIHVEQFGGYYEIWTDAEIPCDGRCVGAGTTFQEARGKAMEELLRDFLACSELRDPKHEAVERVKRERDIREARRLMRLDGDL